MAGRDDRPLYTDATMATPNGILIPSFLPFLPGPIQRVRFYSSRRYECRMECDGSGNDGIDESRHRR